MTVRLKYLKYYISYRISLFVYRYIRIPYQVWKTSRKKVINVVFLAINPDMWKYDEVYKKMERDSRFNPIIVTTPRANIPLLDQIIIQEETLNYFISKRYNVQSGYVRKENKWLDLNILHPDIIFYPQPYDDCIDNSFFYKKFLNTLLCYAPYSFQLSITDWNWNNPFQNYCWRQYLASGYNVEISKKMTIIKGKNAIEAGYFLEEELSMMSRYNRVEKESIWYSDKRKRIIWAPHHSIEDNEMFKVSSFLEICDDMLELRDKFKNDIIIAFKPHPKLKSKLYKVWGKEKTNKYYQNWEQSDNSFYASGDYKALFLGSDGMIHCSGSFIIEYHYTGKPVQYVYSKNRNPPSFSEVGDEALAVHYSAYSINDIYQFVRYVILENKDDMEKQRYDFIKKYLKSSNGKMFSDNVIEDILTSLRK